VLWPIADNQGQETWWGTGRCVTVLWQLTLQQWLKWETATIA